MTHWIGPLNRLLGAAQIAQPLLSAIKEIFKPTRILSFSLDTRPQPILPDASPVGSFQPPRFFSKGSLEAEPRRYSEPSRYLMTESLETPLVRPVPHNMALARSLCKGTGVIKQNKQGLVYLDIDNQFITAMAPHLESQELMRPPYFHLFSMPHGAHIPVISTREARFHYLEQVKECEGPVTFFVEGLYSLAPDTWPEAEEVWFLKVQSPELEAFRQKRFLPSLPNGHAFHIVVAVKPRNEMLQKHQDRPLLRINPGCFAA